MSRSENFGANMTTRVLALLLGLCLTACSGETGDTGGGPDENAPHGAANMEIYTSDAQSCPLGNIHVDLGNTKLSPPELLADGYEGAEVACSVALVTAKWAASGKITQGALLFEFGDILTDGSSATGSVRVKDPESDTLYESPDNEPCIFQFAPSSDQTVEAGKLFIQFDCANLKSQADATKSCASRYGYVYADRCAK